MKTLTIRENELYGCEANWRVMRDLDSFSLNFSFSFVAPQRVDSQSYQNDIRQHLQECVREPYLMDDGFDGTLFERDRANYLAYLHQLETQPISRATLQALRKVMGDEPFARPLTGTPSEVEAATLEELKRTYLRLTDFAPLVVSACGPVGEDEIASWVERIAGDSPRRGMPTTRPYTPHKDALHPRETAEGSSDQFVAFITAAGCQRISRAEFATICALFSTGSRSRLYTRLRETDGISYGHQDVASFEKKLLFVMGSVLPGRGEDAVKALREELDAMGGKDDEPALEGWKREFINGFLKSLDMPGQIAATLNARLAMKRDFDPASTIRRVCRISAPRIAALTSDMRVFADYVASPSESSASESSSSSSASADSASDA
ncbi:MAG: insulinase family protein [Planctomycetota bacterium]|nr:insulinase family protein [Planctomycetota bacterium]